MTNVITNTEVFNRSLGTTSPTTTVPDYWPDFGALQYLEVIYLTIITVLGTIGNLVVIFSIALERRVHAHGNIFIINLAVADLMVSAIIVPTVIANVIKTENALDWVFCDIIGYLVTTTCTCSLCNLTFIALNRYWAVVKPGTYQKTFSRKRVYYMIVFTWLWSLLLVLPTVLGWGGLKYDAKMMVCSWDDVKDKSYTYFIAAIAIFVPLAIIAFCYFKLFSTVRGSGKWVRSLSVGSGISQNTEQHRRSMRKERGLLRTLLTTVLLFSFCWVPFGACVLINPEGTPKHAKKVFGWLALTNSCVNFIIYGAMNPVFRRGYHNLFIFVFRCKRVQHISSTILHGSHSDSFRARGPNKASNGKHQNNYHSKSDTNRENSRVDTFAGVPKGIVESIRRASLLRKTRARANTADNTTSEEDRQWRAKRNSAMLLQIQMGGDEANSEEEDLVRMQDERFSRRTVSDITANMNNRAEEMGSLQKNSNSNITNSDNSNFNIEEIAKVSLRGNWMPDKAVYTSKGNTPILERNPKTSSLNTSPSKRGLNIATVSGQVETHKSDRSQNGYGSFEEKGYETSPVDESFVPSPTIEAPVENKDAVDQSGTIAPPHEQESSYLLSQMTENISASEPATHEDEGER